VRVGKASSTSAPVKSIELGAVRIAGPETAARLGVPVGTPLHMYRDEVATEDTVLAYWHRNPIRRFWGRLTRSRH